LLWRGRLVEIDGDGDLIYAPHDDEVGRASFAGGLDGGRQLLHRGDSVATHGDDQVAPVDARTVGGPTLLDGVDQQTVTLRQPYGMAKATSHPRRSESYAKAYPVGRFSASQRVNAGLQVFAGGQGQVEPLARPVGVDPDEVPFGIDDRPTRRAVGQRGAVLEGSTDRPAFGAPEGEAQPGDEADASAQAPPTRTSQPDNYFTQGHFARGPGQGRCARRVHGEHSQVALQVRPRDVGDRDPAVIERDLHFTAQIVRIGDDQALSDHHTAASPAYPNNRWRCRSDHIGGGFRQLS
jgi:hypothetical protein